MRVWLKTKRGAMGMFPAKEARQVSDLVQKFPTVDGGEEVPVVSCEEMEDFEVRVGADVQGALCSIRMVTGQFLPWEMGDCPIRVFVEEGKRVQFIGLVARMEVLAGKMVIQAEGMR